MLDRQCDGQSTLMFEMYIAIASLCICLILSRIGLHSIAIRMSMQASEIIIGGWGEEGGMQQ